MIAGVQEKKQTQNLTITTKQLQPLKRGVRSLSRETILCHE